MSDTQNFVTESGAPQQTPDEADVLQRMIADLSALPSNSRMRMIDTICVFLGLNRSAIETTFSPSQQVKTNHAPTFQFSEDDVLSFEAPSIKQFMHEKSPQTDVERVACLAFYLARYRGTLHIKTKDITELNKESAHRPFSNTAFAVDNATKTGYLVPSIKGSKQISAYGERFVEALPDRETAKEIMASARMGRRVKSAKKIIADAA